MWEVRILPKPTLRYPPTGLMSSGEMGSHPANTNPSLRSFLISWLPRETSVYTVDFLVFQVLR